MENDNTCTTLPNSHFQVGTREDLHEFWKIKTKHSQFSLHEAGNWENIHKTNAFDS